MELEFPVSKELAAQAIGLEVLEHLKETWTPEKLAQEAESRALKALEDIRRVLDDDKLEDPECFRRIEAIVNALEANGIRTSRHDL